MSIGLIALFGVLTTAVATDLYARRIPNVLVLAGLVAGLAFHWFALPGSGVLSTSAGSTGITSALSGAAVGLVSLLPLYALRAMGAGDVKLMMAVGAFLGPLQTLGAVVLTFAAGGVLAIATTLWQRSFSHLAINLRFMLTHGMVRAATGETMKFEPLQHTAGRMPYAVAIFAGTLLQLILVRSGGWALS